MLLSNIKSIYLSLNISPTLNEKELKNFFSKSIDISFDFKKFISFNFTIGSS